MIGPLASLFSSAGPSGRLPRILTIGALVLLAIGGLWLGKHLYDRSVVRSHGARQAAEVERLDRAADATVATQRRADDARLAAETHALEKVLTDAPADPRAARRAYLDCVRLQQQARAAHRLTPAC